MEISYRSYLQLIGLLALAEHHNRMLEDILTAALEITDETDSLGVPDTSGHTADAIYTNISVDELLIKLGITHAFKKDE